MTITNELDWYQQNLDDANQITKLIFGEVWWAELDSNEFYSVGPVNDPVAKRRLWAVSFNDAEIDRTETLDEAKEAAQEHHTAQ